VEEKPIEQDDEEMDSGEEGEEGEYEDDDEDEEVCLPPVPWRR
jgi:hypothetical protein